MGTLYGGVRPSAPSNQGRERAHILVSIPVSPSSATGTLDSLSGVSIHSPIGRLRGEVAGLDAGATRRILEHKVIFQPATPASVIGRLADRAPGRLQRRAPTARCPCGMSRRPRRCSGIGFGTVSASRHSAAEQEAGSRCTAAESVPVRFRAGARA